MIVEIKFLPGFQETTLPIIKLTKSRNGKTGTATFVFIKPTTFKKDSISLDSINGVQLIWEKNKIITKDVCIFFKKGNPFLLKSVFLFKNSREWFHFLTFMNAYSKETGLFFAETKSFF